jgi:UDP-N-acetylmuramoyl-tripeptide--D-alanyl-D-alanine ligase
MLPQSIEKLYNYYLKCEKTICTDTRNIKPGSLFCCLKGANFDGNEFAESALKAGAAYVIADRRDVITDSRILWVEDCLDTLQALAHHHRKQLKNTVFIGIGGSNGKTTTKELLLAVLGSEKKVKGTRGNLNNHIGVPLTLLELSGDEDFAVIEMGTNHPGEMKVLCDIVAADWGIVTNIGKEHLEGFGSFDAIIREESELFDQLQKSGGLAFVNLDDAVIANMAKRFSKFITYGCTENAEVKGEVIHGMPVLEYSVVIKNEIYGPQKANIGGNYNLSNILAAVSIGIQAGIDTEKAISAACRYIPSNNRSQWIEKGNKHILLDCYNANPSSMIAAIHSFADIKGTKAILLGDMFELGAFAKPEHEAIVKLAAKSGFNEIFYCGSHFKESAGEYPFGFESTAKLQAWLANHPVQSEYILIKGSRGMKMETLLDTIQ